MMFFRTQHLQRDAGRVWEVLIGWICAVVSTAFSAGFVILLYLMGWRNPREYGDHDLFKLTSLAILASVLAIAGVFSVIAYRLISRAGRPSGLLSPLVLRIWGAFFGLLPVVILVDAVVSRKWDEVLRNWGVFTGSVSMACAAFVLARKRERMRLDRKDAGQPGI